MQIIPAILPHNFEEIQEKCSRVEELVPLVQIDICDGIFGLERTWIPIGTETLPAGFLYEFDIMVNDWKSVLEGALALSPARVVMHMDLFSDEDVASLVEMIAPHSIPLGVSVSNDKEVEFHADMLRKVRALYPNVFLQVMGIPRVGEQGLVFDEETPMRIVKLKQMFGDVLVQVDGGMMLETARKVEEVGAESIVVGSYIFGSEDAGGAIERLSQVEMPDSVY